MPIILITVTWKHGVINIPENIILFKVECFVFLNSNLGENRFPKLPTDGLHNLHVLKVFNNKELTDFPAASAFPKVQQLYLSYAYHCCEFTEVVKTVIDISY